jgi:hypothetical protein
MPTGTVPFMLGAACIQCSSQFPLPNDTSLSIDASKFCPIYSLTGTGKLTPQQGHVTIEGLETNETYIFGLAGQCT